MGFTPRAPKPVKQREFTDVQLVAGENWTWQVPDTFTLAEIARIRQVPYDHCHRWLMRELNKPVSDIIDDTPPSQIVRTQEQAASELILRTLAAQNKEARIIPNDEMLKSVINRFYENIGVNQWSDAVCLEQLDLICIPKNGAPKVSSVADRADKELMNDLVNFFYRSQMPSTKEKEKQELSMSDSGKKEKSSKKKTDTEVI
jgi:hypothetical protein